MKDDDDDDGARNIWAVLDFGILWDLFFFLI